MLKKDVRGYFNQKKFGHSTSKEKIVPFSNLGKYKKSLPEVETEAIVFKKRGHFGQSKFPEIIKAIKKLK